MNEYRNLVICNNCLWAVSLLKGSNGFKICPICRNENLEVVPVEDHESYTMNIDSKRGIEIDFTKEKKVKGLRNLPKGILKQRITTLIFSGLRKSDRGF